MIPEDQSFWTSLGRLITTALRESKDPHVRFLSVDDLIGEVPHRVEEDGRTVWLAAWMLGDAQQEKYKLAIKLDRPVDEMRQADWDDLLSVPLNPEALKVDKADRTMTLLAPSIS